MSQFPPGREYGPSFDAGFLEPRRILFDNVNTPLDLGDIGGFNGEIKGFIGDQSGAASLFFRFRLIRQSEIQLKLLRVNKYTDVFLQVALLGSDRRSIRLDEEGFARNVEDESTPTSEAFKRLRAGEYTIVVSTTQWNNIPYRLFIFIKGSVSLNAKVSLDLSLLRTAFPVPIRLKNRTTLRSSFTRSVLFSGRPTVPLRARTTLSGSVANSALVPLLVPSTGWISRLATPAESARRALGDSTFTSDGGVVSAFLYRPPGAISGNVRVCFVKHRADGSVAWARATSELLSFSVQGTIEAVYAVTPTNDGGVIFSYGFPFIITSQWARVGRLSGNGTISWVLDYQLNSSDVNSTPYLRKVFYEPITNRVIVTGLSGTRNDGPFYPTWMILDGSSGADLCKRRILFNPDTFDSYGGSGIQAALRLSNGNIRFICNISPSGCLVFDTTADGNTILQAKTYRDGGSFSVSSGALTPTGNTVLVGNNIVVVLDSSLNPIRKLEGGVGQGFSDQVTVQIDTLGRLWAFDPSDNQRGLTFVVDLDGGICYHASYCPVVPGTPVGPGFLGAEGNSKRIDLVTRKRLISYSRQSLVTPAVAGKYFYVSVHEINTLGSANTGIGGFSWRPASWHQAPVSSLPGLTAEAVTPPPAAEQWIGSADVPFSLSILENAAGLLTWDLSRNPTPGGLQAPIPAPKPFIDPLVESDSIASQVVLHLPFTGGERSRVAYNTSVTSEDLLIATSGQFEINSTTSPFIGDQSAVFNGTDAFLFATANPLLQFDRGDLCVESWIFLSSSGTPGGCIFSNTGFRGNSALIGSFSLVVTSARVLAFKTNGVNIETSAPAIGPGLSTLAPLSDPIDLETWVHVALCRQDDVWRSVINYKHTGFNYRVEVSLTQGELLIGKGPRETVEPEWFNGRMRDFRITLNSRYRKSSPPRNFPIQTPVVPAAPSDSNYTATTSILLPLQGPDRLITDAGPARLVPTVIGNSTALQAASLNVPLFGYPTIRFNGVNSGALGASSRIEFASTLSLSLPEDFLIEVWIWCDPTPAFPVSRILGRGALNAAGSYQILYKSADNGVYFRYDAGTERLCGIAVPGEWQYVAATRAGNELSTYLQGIRGSVSFDTTNLSSSFPLTIGARADGAGDVFRGYIAQLRIKKDFGLTGTTLFIPQEPWGLSGP